MLTAIKRFFDSQLDPAASSEQDDEHRLRLAVAVLLLEVAESDYDDLPEERDAILHSIRSQFGLDEEEAEQLVTLAESEHGDKTDNYQFTSLINQHYLPQQKIQIIEALWRVAFADQKLHHYEEHMVRRLAELLHVSHSEFIAAKHRVMSEYK